MIAIGSFAGTMTAMAMGASTRSTTALETHELPHKPEDFEGLDRIDRIIKGAENARRNDDYLNEIAVTLNEEEWIKKE